MTQGLTRSVDRIADFAYAYRDGLKTPPDVLHAGKRSILNVLGASVGAMETEPLRVLRNWARAVGPGSNRVLWTADTFSEELAALVNAAGMHVLDFDDTLVGFHAHASPPSLGAALAVARADQSGAELLAAFCIGVEIHFALAKGLMLDLYHRGFHITAIGAAVATAAVAGVLRGLGREELRHAVATAAISAAGLGEGLVSMSNAFGVGNSARVGITAAGLAEHGFRSALSAIDGTRGLREAMSGASEEQLGAALAGLGTHWHLRENSFKQFPTETISQAAVEGLLALRLREAGRPGSSEVTSIILETSPLVAEIIGERSARTTPNDVLTRTFDTKYCAASAWLTASFSPATMTPLPELDRQVLGLRERITVSPEPAFGSESVRITVELESGDVLTETVDGYVGSWRRPMADAGLEAKLLRSGDLSPSAHRRICDAIWALGPNEPVGHLMTLLGPFSPAET